MLELACASDTYMTLINSSKVPGFEHINSISYITAPLPISSTLLRRRGAR